MAAAEAQHKRGTKGFGLLKGRARRGGDAAGEAPAPLPSPRPVAVRSSQPAGIRAPDVLSRTSCRLAKPDACAWGAAGGADEVGAARL